MNIDRMNHMITVLEGVIAADKAFNLSGWVMNEASMHRDDPDFVKNHWNTVGNVQKTCGTSACAMGYAALDPAFQAQGLTLKIEVYGPDGRTVEYPVTTVKEFNEITRRPTLEVDEIYIRFNGQDGIGAAMEFFGITEKAATWMFLPDHYEDMTQDNQVPITPQAVIDRLRAVIEAGGELPQA